MLLLCKSQTTRCYIQCERNMIKFHLGIAHTQGLLHQGGICCMAMNDLLPLAASSLEAGNSNSPTHDKMDILAVSTAFTRLVFLVTALLGQEVQTIWLSFLMELSSHEMPCICRQQRGCWGGDRGVPKQQLCRAARRLCTGQRQFSAPPIQRAVCWGQPCGPIHRSLPATPCKWGCCRERWHRLAQHLCLLPLLLA